ncbi:hypothetical protein HanIR_Chr17g0866561 [Helianthus annuus]|nr:hypothetical protein HanIR_Chr17g0866561 [Helianthus annuus]
MLAYMIAAGYVGNFTSKQTKPNPIFPCGCASSSHSNGPFYPSPYLATHQDSPPHNLPTVFFESHHDTLDETAFEKLYKENKVTGSTQPPRKWSSNKTGSVHTLPQTPDKLLLTIGGLCTRISLEIRTKRRYCPR